MSISTSRSSRLRHAPWTARRSRYGYLGLFGDSGKIVRGEYATIIQHPDGRQKHIASRNNKIDVYPYDDDLSDAEKAANNFLYYSTDTLKGSSGSPVFSDQWFVVALHRRGVPQTRMEGGKLVVVRTNDQPAADDDLIPQFLAARWGGLSALNSS